MTAPPPRRAEGECLRAARREWEAVEARIETRARVAGTTPLRGIYSASIPHLGQRTAEEPQERLDALLHGLGRGNLALHEEGEPSHAVNLVGAALHDVAQLLPTRGTGTIPPEPESSVGSVPWP